ncbi:MAG: hypothetical protein K2X55_05455 [Burkholderiaceae bacterium]|nr:hypothetical protein [Burkholderiaceae bacterium]
MNHQTFTATLDGRWDAIDWQKGLLSISISVALASGAAHATVARTLMASVLKTALGVVLPLAVLSNLGINTGGERSTSGRGWREKSGASGLCGRRLHRPPHIQCRGPDDGPDHASDWAGCCSGRGYTGT